MPRGDRTGPEGLGPMTGRRMGFCAGYDAPGYYYGNPNAGRGFSGFFGRGRGLGFGRGFRSGFGGQYTAYPQASTSDVPDKEELKEEMKNLKNRLSVLEKNLSEQSNSA